MEVLRNAWRHDVEELRNDIRKLAGTYIPSLATTDCYTIKEEDFKTKEFNETNEDLDQLRDPASRTVIETLTVTEVVRKVVEQFHRLYSNANADPIDGGTYESSVKIHEEWTDYNMCDLLLVECATMGKTMQS